MRDGRAGGEEEGDGIPRGQLGLGRRDEAVPERRRGVEDEPRAPERARPERAEEKDRRREIGTLGDLSLAPRLLAPLDARLLGALIAAPAHRRPCIPPAKRPSRSAGISAISRSSDCVDARQRLVQREEAETDGQRQPDEEHVALRRHAPDQAEGDIEHDEHADDGRGEGDAGLQELAPERQQAARHRRLERGPGPQALEAHRDGADQQVMAVHREEQEQGHGIEQARDEPLLPARRRIVDHPDAQPHLEADELARDLRRRHHEARHEADGEADEDLARHRDDPAERVEAPGPGGRAQGRREDQRQDRGEPRAVRHGDAAVADDGRPGERRAETEEGEQEALEVPREESRAAPAWLASLSRETRLEP